MNFGEFPAEKVMELTPFSPCQFSSSHLPAPALTNDLVSPGYGYRDRPAWAQQHGEKSEEQFWVIDDVKETAKLLAQAKQEGSQQLEDFITERKTYIDEKKEVSELSYYTCTCSLTLC